MTVRGEDNDFYVCRVLHNVVESADKFRVAWCNRIADNLYEVSVKCLGVRFIVDQLFPGSGEFSWCFHGESQFNLFREI